MGKSLEANKNRLCYAYFINLATFDWLIEGAFEIWLLKCQLY